MLLLFSLQVVTKWEDTLSAEKQQRDEEIRKLRADLEFTEAEAEVRAQCVQRLCCGFAHFPVSLVPLLNVCTACGVMSVYIHNAI